MSLKFDHFCRSQAKALYTFWKEGLFPVRCLVCGGWGSVLHTYCKNFPLPPQNQVQYQYVDALVAATKYYDPLVQKLIEHFKFKGDKSLAFIMAELMSQRSEDLLSQSQVLVPVPLHWRRWLFRGYNQSYLLAKALQKRHPHLVINHAFKRIRHTQQQARLSREDRLANLFQAFVWKGGPVPSRVLLIDDVVASGSTLDQAAKCLKEQGVKRVQALVFARGGQE